MKYLFRSCILLLFTDSQIDCLLNAPEILTLMVLIFARTNFQKFHNARKLVPNLRSKGSARKLIHFKIKIFLLKNLLLGRFIRGESCEHDLGLLFVYMD